MGNDDPAEVRGDGAAAARPTSGAFKPVSSADCSAGALPHALVLVRRPASTWPATVRALCRTLRLGYARALAQCIRAQCFGSVVLFVGSFEVAEFKLAQLAEQAGEDVIVRSGFELRVVLTA